jgi:hypothetical protein
MRPKSIVPKLDEHKSKLLDSKSTQNLSVTSINPERYSPKVSFQCQNSVNSQNDRLSTNLLDPQYIAKQQGHRLSRVSNVSADFLKTCFLETLDNYFNENDDILALNSLKFLACNNMNVTQRENFANRILSNIYTVFALVLNLIVNSVIVLTILIVNGIDVHVYSGVISISLILVSLLCAIIVILLYIKLTNSWFYKRLHRQNDLNLIDPAMRAHKSLLLNNFLITFLTLLVLTNVTANIFFYMTVVNHFKKFIKVIFIQQFELKQSVQLNI